MTSKLIVNSLAADTGVSTITFADQAKMGNSLFHSTGFTIGDSFLHSTGVNLTNVNATGVITATKFVGEVSVGSSITFEDNEKAYFGTSTDFSIYHNGSASYLDETGTGGLIAKTNTAFQVFNSAGSQPAFTVTPGGSVELYHGSTKRIESASYGALITGQCYVSHSGTTPGFSLSDNGRSAWGASDDLQIYHQSSDNNSYIKETGGGSLVINADDFYLQNNATTTFLRTHSSGAIDLNYGGNIKLATTSSGVTVTGTLLADKLKVNDGEHVTLGNDNDLRIYFDGSNSAWNNSTGNNYFYGGGGNFFFRPVNAEQALNIIANGAVELFHNDVKVLTTTTEGIRVQGAEGGAGKLEIYADEGDDNADKWHFLANTDGTLLMRNLSDGSWDTNIRLSSTKTELFYDDQPKFETSNTGATVLGNLAFASGNGIDFSATGDSSGSMSSELFDDYEEGTWTPTAHGYTGSNTSNNCHYTKIGRLVTASFRITWPSLTSTTNAEIRGLPFSSITTGEYVFGGAFSETNDNDSLSFIVVSNSSKMLILRCTSSGVDTQNISEVSGKDFRGTVSYFTNS